jgi:hypothetical protein
MKYGRVRSKWMNSTISTWELVAYKSSEDSPAVIVYPLILGNIRNEGYWVPRLSIYPVELTDLEKIIYGVK